jgi:hypothetical protein
MRLKPDYLALQNSGVTRLSTRIRKSAISAKRGYCDRYFPFLGWPPWQDTATLGCRVTLRPFCALKLAVA